MVWMNSNSFYKLTTDFENPGANKTWLAAVYEHINQIDFY